VRRIARNPAACNKSYGLMDEKIGQLIALRYANLDRRRSRVRPLDLARFTCPLDMCRAAMT
jgi:hypothetical protein